MAMETVASANGSPRMCPKSMAGPGAAYPRVCREESVGMMGREWWRGVGEGAV